MPLDLIYEIDLGGILKNRKASRADKGWIVRIVNGLPNFPKLSLNDNSRLDFEVMPKIRAPSDVITMFIAVLKLKILSSERS